MDFQQLILSVFQVVKTETYMVTQSMDFNSVACSTSWHDVSSNRTSTFSRMDSSICKSSCKKSNEQTAGTQRPNVNVFAVLFWGLEIKYSFCWFIDYWWWWWWWRLIFFQVYSLLYKEWSYLRRTNLFAARLPYIWKNAVDCVISKRFW